MSNNASLIFTVATAWLYADNTMTSVSKLLIVSTAATETIVR